MYNGKYVKANKLKQKFEQPSKDQASNQVDIQAFKTHSETKIPPTKELFRELGAELPILEEV